MFALDRKKAKVTSGKSRKEFHGDQGKTAYDLRLALTLPNAVLDDVAPGLLEAMYRPGSEKAQADLADQGTDALTALRYPDMKSLAFTTKWQGFLVQVDHGAKKPIELKLADLVDLVLDLKDGGSVDVTFRVVAYPSTQTMGILDTLAQEEVTVTLSEMDEEEEESPQLSIVGGTEVEDPPEPAPAPKKIAPIGEAKLAKMANKMCTGCQGAGCIKPESDADDAYRVCPACINHATLADEDCPDCAGDGEWEDQAGIWHTCNCVTAKIWGVRQWDEEAETEDETAVPDPAAVIAEAAADLTEEDRLYDEALKAIRAQKKCSLNFLKRACGATESQVTPILERLVTEGVISGPNGRGQYKIEDEAAQA